MQLYSIATESHHLHSKQIKPYMFGEMSCTMDSLCLQCTESSKTKEHKYSSKLDSEHLFELFTDLPVEEKVSFLQKILQSVDKPLHICIATEMVKYHRLNVKEDMNMIDNSYRNLSYLKRLEIQEYLKQRESSLLQYICGVAGLQDLKAMYIAHLIENVYKLINATFIGPVSFLTNLSLLQVTNCKLGVNMVGSQGSRGQYTTIHNCLQDVGGKNEVEVPNDDLLFMFDNDQIVGRSWNICPNNKVQVSIIINVAVVQLNATILL